MSVSTFNSSINSVNNNYDDKSLEGKMKIKIDLLAKDLGNMNLNDRKMIQYKERKVDMNDNRERIFQNNIKKTSNNPNLATRVSKLKFDY